MRDMNLWTIIGNLTKDPLLNHLDDGTPVCHLRMAVSPRRETAGPAYVDVTAWRRDAEHCATYLRKGSRLCVAGPLHATLVTLKDGRPILDLAVDAKYLEFMGGPGLSPKAPEDPPVAQQPTPRRPGLSPTGKGQGLSPACRQAGRKGTVPLARTPKARNTARQ
ncbi:MAG: single-stranded DNA-binding protein [Candidatus Omnitrophica bacterium]|nr:single-stranded DNA-binding protein [Candidatus Omnitrophota bacterium]